MDKLNIKKSFQTKKFKYGSYAALMTAVVLVILLIVNLLAGELNIKLDLTKNKIFSLSDQTIKVLGSLNQNIDMYVFGESGKEDPMLKAMIEKYQQASDKITLQYKDPVKYPQFAKQYSQNGADVQQGSIVIALGQKFRLISPNDLFNYTYDQSGQQVPDSLAFENKVTGAIIFVTSKTTPVIYTLQGHEELALSSSVTNKLENDNYTVKDLDFAVKDAQLTPDSTLIVDSPQRDLTADETTKIKEFLASGGRAIFAMDIPSQNNILPNFQSILNTYGVGMKNAIVVEPDPSYSTQQNPLFLVPMLQEHEIMTPLVNAKLPVFIPGAQVIETLSVKKNSTIIEPLLTTTDSAWAKTDSLNAKTINKEANDLTGPFNIAVAITDTSNTSKNTKLVVVSNGSFADSDYADLYGNSDFIVNSINWLQDKKDLISIAPKNISEGGLNLTSLQALMYSGIVVIIIPLIIAVWGISVLLRRKRQ